MKRMVSTTIPVVTNSHFRVTKFALLVSRIDKLPNNIQILITALLIIIPALLEYYLLSFITTFPKEMLLWGIDLYFNRDLYLLFLFSGPYEMLKLAPYQNFMGAALVFLFASFCIPGLFLIWLSYRLGGKKMIQLEHELLIARMNTIMYSIGWKDENYKYYFKRSLMPTNDNEEVRINPLYTVPLSVPWKGTIYAPDFEEFPWEYANLPEALSEIDLTLILPLVNKLNSVIEILSNFDTKLLKGLVDALMGYNTVNRDIYVNFGNPKVYLNMPHAGDLTNLKYFEDLTETVISKAITESELCWSPEVHSIFPTNRKLEIFTMELIRLRKINLNDPNLIWYIPELWHEIYKQLCKN